MTSVLVHRGPDGEGHWSEGPIALGHRRLAIVDLSETGAQPMPTADRRGWLTYNGEFYNHRDFRRQLEQRGVRFRGPSDSETLLYLLAEYGPDALKDVAGIFGLAFWDAHHRRLILARDPMGVKQVYFHDDGHRLVFASEIKALFQHSGVPCRPDFEGLNQYLHFHTPLFARTAFADIQQVEPGQYLTVSGSGVRRKTYWQLDGFEADFRSPEEAVEALQATLQTVVTQQLMSDVPVGAFFSGGIDSTAVASFARRSVANLQCFGVHFHGQGVIDELPYQQSAAQSLSVPLSTTTLDGESFPEDLARLLYFQDQPLIGAAMLPMYAVSQLASTRVKVCLGGQAADELFGGYARYALADPLGVLARWRSGRGGRGAEGSAGTAHSARVGGNLAKQLHWKNIARLGRVLLSARDGRRRYFDNFAQVGERAWQSVFAAREAVSRDRAWEAFRAGVESSPAPDESTRMMHWDQRTYLPGLFAQDDRMSMANSLESRVPLADPRVARFAFRVPFEWKFRAGASKWILRQAVADVIPELVLNRRKVGFDTPADTWMRGPHAAWVRDVLTGTRTRDRGWFDVRGIVSKLERPDQAEWFPIMWKLLCLEVWARQFMDGEGVERYRAAPPRRVERGS